VGRLKKEKIDYLPPFCMKIREMGEAKRPKCPTGQCYSVIVHIEDTYAEWRCTKCLNYTSVEMPRAGQASLF